MFTSLNSDLFLGALYQYQIDIVIQNDISDTTSNPFFLYLITTVCKTALLFTLYKKQGEQEDETE